MVLLRYDHNNHLITLAVIILCGFHCAMFLSGNDVWTWSDCLAKPWKILINLLLTRKFLAHGVVVVDLRLVGNLPRRDDLSQPTSRNFLKLFSFRIRRQVEGGVAAVVQVHAALVALGRDGDADKSGTVDVGRHFALVLGGVTSSSLWSISKSKFNGKYTKLLENNIFYNHKID